MKEAVSRLTRANICGSNFSYQHQHFSHFLDDMVDLDLRRIELWGSAPHLYIPHTTGSDIRRIKQQFDERELTLHSLTPEQVAYPVNIASGSTTLRGKSIDLFLRGAEITAELGGKYLFLTPGRGYEDEPVASGWQRSVDALGEIITHAATLGLTCLFEPLQRGESNLVNTIPDMKRMLSELPSRHVEVVLDTVAMAVAGEKVADYFEAFPLTPPDRHPETPRVGHVHFVDGSPAGHLAWGDGELPLDTYLDDLNAHGYTGRLTFEIFGDGNYALDPRTYLEQCLSRFEARG